MKEKQLCKIFFLMLLLSSSTTSFSQSINNFYHRIDVSTSNIYTFAFSNLITGYANYYANDMLFDNSYGFSYYDFSNQNGASTSVKRNDIVGLTARDLFNDVSTGVKLGYISDSPGNINFGVYASFHYKVDQFKTKIAENENLNSFNLQRLQPGVGIVFVLGNISSSTKVVLEGGCRYDIPFAFKGFGQEGTNYINKGLSGHYSVKIGGPAWLQGIGIYLDMMHYDLIKKDAITSNLPNVKFYNFGITYTLTPWKIEEYR